MSEQCCALLVEKPQGLRLDLRFHIHKTLIVEQYIDQTKYKRVHTYLG